MCRVEGTVLVTKTAIFLAAPVSNALSESNTLSRSKVTSGGEDRELSASKL